MAPDGGQTGEEVSTVITCEGTLGHPEFPRQFQKVVDRLNGLLGVPVKVRKLEPWNSVRVTLSVPREAALRLRQLAQQGASQLRALGILSVQLDGEGAISLRLQGANGEPQEVVLRTTQDGPSTNSSSIPLGLGALLPTASGASGSSPASSQVQFKSPNVVCPPDSVVPRVGANMVSTQSTLAPNPLNKPPYAGPFPFASMNQAIHSQNNSGSPTSAPRSTNMEPPPPFLPPPYPSVRQTSSSSLNKSPNNPPVTLSSPLLVNLLQNDQVGSSSGASSSTTAMVQDLPPPASPSMVRQMRPPPPPQPPSKVAGLHPPLSPSPSLPSSLQTQPTKTAAAPPQLTGTPNHITSQANVLVNSSNNNISNSSVNNSRSMSPQSALSTSVASNTSPVMTTNSPVISTNHTQHQLASSSLVTSTQMAINSIANSLASVANNLTSSSSNTLGQQGMFGFPKTGFAHVGGVGNQPSVHHYQRTPQGSIIAVNKPLPVSNQIMGTSVQNTIPLHQALRKNVQTQNNQGILRQQQITSIPPKTSSMFTQNTAASLQSNMVHQNQVKMMPGNQNNMSISNQNTVVSGSNVSSSGNRNMLHHSGGGSPKNSRGLSSGNMVVDRIGQQQQSQHSLPGQSVNMGGLSQQTEVHTNANVGLSSSESLKSCQVNLHSAQMLSKSLPSPPPYNVAISRSWDPTSNLLDLAPSLTDLKADDLDDILPTLGHDPLPELSELELLAGPGLNSNSEGPSSSDEHVNSNSNGSSGLAAAADLIEENSINSEGNDGRKFLINPLTGELEPHSGGESDAEEVRDVFTGLPSPLGLSDEDTNSTVRPDTTTDQSDSETRSSNDGKHPRVKNSKIRREGRDSPALKPTEKIKLRLKMEKSELVNPAYKVDVSFINTQQPKKASTSVITPTTPSANEELRVPPLHIQLRGRNAAVIKNKIKLNPDGTPIVKKMRKLQGKGKKEGSDEEGSRDGESVNEHKKAKKMKGNYDHKDLLATLSDNPLSPSNNTISKYSLHNHYSREKQKERRGSDSELVRSNSRKHDANGALGGDEKRRRLSQSEGEKRLEDEGVPSVLGSTNVGTVGVLPQKIRKDKIKIKESFKIKDSNRKLYSTSKSNLTSNIPSPPDKLQLKQSVILPTASDVDMEAKFKQSLMESVIGEKGIPRPPHRTVEHVVHMVESVRVGVGTVGDKVTKNPMDLSQKPSLSKEKSPEPDKCNVPDRDRKSIDSLQERDKQLNAVVTSGGRSPNSGSSGGQGEDSGIESMDALSEKSPNQASQSPHADILPNVAVPTSKTQVPDMLDIEAQLAKMEGLDHHATPSDPKNHQNANSNATMPMKKSENVQKLDRSPNRTVEDVNENECIHRNDAKSCCDLTCTLQDTLSKGDGDNEEEIVPLKSKKEDQQPSNSPPALRVAPAIYTYPSNTVDKSGGGRNSRGGSESPSLTTEDEDSNLEPLTGQTHINNKSKSLLEQLLIEIPSEHHGSATTPSSHSPATRSSVRTRALSKLGSPELSSPVPKTTRTAPPVATAKRKRNESDSSNHSVDEAKKRPRKGSEASEVGKRVIQPINLSKKVAKIGNIQNQPDESSDSDEPLIEKLRKNAPKSNTKVTKGAVNQGTPQTTSASQINNKTNTRRSARAGNQHEKDKQEKQLLPAQNTRSREKVVQQQQQQNSQQQQQVTHSNADAEAALRRKTRSADVESKRKKEVK